MSEAPLDGRYFFDGGIRFSCTECGNCCTGGPGVVRVTREEQEALAGHLGISPRAFRNRYTRRVEGKEVLVERDNGDCIFFSGNRCTVYAHRPRQCRTYPFWFKNLRSEEAWRKTCQACPGIGEGRLHPAEEILRVLQEENDE